MARRVEGIDERWLARAAARDPVPHAYAVWDLQEAPERVSFVSWVEGTETLAYRLEWRWDPDRVMVHWVGRPDAPGLLEAWPPRPFVAVVPTEVAPAIERRFPPTTTYPVEIRALPGPMAPPGPSPGVVRRLRTDDAPALAAMVASEADRLLEGYEGIDLRSAIAFGAFEGARLVAVAKASVTLPRVWVLSGIVTAVDRRGRGFGRAVTAAAASAAIAAGARPALYVRSDNAPAVRMYERLGFRREAGRAWIDAGAARPP